MRVYVILHGDTKKPDSDEIIGFKLNALDARSYCEAMNALETETGAFYFEPAELIK